MRPLFSAFGCSSTAGIQADAMKQKMENLTNEETWYWLIEGTYNTVYPDHTLCIPVFGFPVSLVLNPRMKITILEVPPALTQRLEYAAGNNASLFQ